MNHCPHCGFNLGGVNYALYPECFKHLHQRFGFGDLGEKIIRCAYCNGRGEVNTGSLFGAWTKACSVCGGTGVNRV